ncbi:ribosomal protein L21-like protein [Chaetomium fimeti]|uniref:Large ribosomal subunit protein bL21m n=1 Tax=Chaetomium fimeti TaxID=1854472 RepID=A0AAE0LVA2_9PEZI|nr:ribosomal protein L21-like protein [Chaetomium fimeti]
MSRALLRSVLELRAPVTRLVPSARPTTMTTTTTKAATTALPAATARFFNQTAQHVEPTPQPLDPTLVGSTPTPPAPPSLQPHSRRTPPSAPAPTTPSPISDSVRTLLPALAAQPGHYITVQIHGRPYLVTAGDSVRLPFKMPGVEPGAVLRLNRATAVGSRDFTLRGAPFVDERLFECRAVVTGTEAEPMRTMVKKKRRCRRSKRVTSKHRFTMLRISELKIRPEVVEEES